MNAPTDTTSATCCYFAMYSVTSTEPAKEKKPAPWQTTHGRDVRIQWVGR